MHRNRSYIIAGVSLIVRAARVFGLVALLLVTLAPPAVACCSGVADCHRTTKDSKSCCEKAEEDVLAMKCCQGGEEFNQSQPSSGLQSQLPSASAVSTAPVLAGGEPPLDPQPPPFSHSGPLYTLHSALLI